MELLLTIAVVAVLAGGSLALISGSLSAAKEQKLSQDLIALNAAASTFLASGGSLAGATTAEEVVERIKTRASDSSADQVVGLRGGMLDSRITPVKQTSAEAQSSAPRIYFHVTKRRFVLAHRGEIGIKEFVLDEEKADDVETDYERRTSIEYSKKGDDKWVWDYADNSTAANSGPTDLPFGGSSPQRFTGSGGATPLELDPPVVSVPGDIYPLLDYDGFAVTLRDQNPRGASDLFYSTVAGVWEAYSGPIPLEPGSNLETKAVSLDPQVWTDSPVDLDEYRTTPVVLDITIDFANPSYDYVSLGGALEPGSYPAPSLVQPGLVSLNNSSSIPTKFLNSGVFNIQWTLDGSDPATAASPNVGDSFSDGFPGQTVPILLDEWGPGDTLEIRAYAKSDDPEIVSDSAVAIASLPATRIQLREPLVDIDLTTDEGTFSLQSDYGDMPVGAWIYYTTDGSDPGIAADGGPITGKLYTDPIPDASTVELNARVYAPVIYSQWFLPSEVATELPTNPPPSIGFTMTVSTSAP